MISVSAALQSSARQEGNGDPWCFLIARELPISGLCHTVRFETGQRGLRLVGCVIYEICFHTSPSGQY